MLHRCFYGAPECYIYLTSCLAEPLTRIFEKIKRELCEAPVLGMPTEKGIYVLDTDTSVVAISGILHQEQKWNGRTVLRPIAYGSKMLSDTEMK